MFDHWGCPIYLSIYCRRGKVLDDETILSTYLTIFPSFYLSIYCRWGRVFDAREDCCRVQFSLHCDCWLQEGFLLLRRAVGLRPHWGRGVYCSTDLEKAFPSPIWKDFQNHLFCFPFFAHHTSVFLPFSLFFFPYYLPIWKASLLNYFSLGDWEGMGGG